MKVSIVSIVYNGRETIGDCIKSVLSQSYPDIEHIVIDGGSTDGTQKEIELYLAQLAHYTSEKDKGVFDAYNKGIQKATGNIIGILNSDDFFYEPDTIKKVVDAFVTSQADLVYAKGMFVDKEDPAKIKRIYSSGPFRKSNLSFGWIPLHTTIFVRREVFARYGFYNGGFRIASDYEISLRWFNNEEIKKYFLNEWVVKMRLGGLSTSPDLQVRKSKEDLRIIRQYQLQGYFTLACKIGRKIPQYIIPRIMDFEVSPQSRLN